MRAPDSRQNLAVSSKLRYTGSASDALRTGPLQTKRARRIVLHACPLGRATGVCAYPLRYPLPRRFRTETESLLLPWKCSIFASKLLYASFACVRYHGEAGLPSVSLASCALGL